MKRTISAILMSLMFVVSAVSQTLFEEVTPVTVQIKSVEGYDADYLGVIGVKSVTFKLNLYSKISRAGNKLNVTIENGNLKLDTPCEYKGFDISQFVEPQVFDLDYTIVKSDGKEICETVDSDNEFYKGGTLVSKNIVGEVGTSCKIRINSFALHYDKSGVRDIDKHISIIEDYYNADARLLLMEQELATIRVDSVEALDEYRQITINNVSVLNKMKSERFSSKLDLETKDPVDLISHISRTEQQNRAIKKSIESKLATLYEAYYQKGLDWLKWGNENEAVKMFNKSIEVKLNYAPPHYQLSLLDLNKRNYSQVLDSCVRITRDMDPDSDTRYNTLRLAEKVIFTYIDSIKGFISARKVDEGFALLEVSKNYCKNIKGIRQFVEFEELAGQLYGTIYSRLIEQAQTHFNDKKYELCYQMIDSANHLRNEYPQHNINSSAEDKLANKLYNAWIEQGKQMLSTNKPDDALNAFDHATFICRKFKSVECSAELEKLGRETRTKKYNQMLDAVSKELDENFADTAISMLAEASRYQAEWELEASPKVDELYVRAFQIKYDALMHEGDVAMKAHQPREALAFYKSAQTISNSCKVTPDSLWFEKNERAAITYTVQLCEFGVSYAALLQMGRAGQQYQFALGVAETNDVASDPDVLDALRRLSEALNDGECSKAWYDYNIQVGSADRLIRQKEFLKARQSLGRAAAIARANYKCNLSDSVVVARTYAISAICKYQRLVNSIQPMLEEKQFADALETYIAATSFFADSCNNSFGIKHKPTFDYVIHNKYSELIVSAVLYYTSTDELDNACKMLDELYRRYFEAMWAKECQTELGIALARRDFRKSPNADPREKVLDYTRNDKWYNNLKKAYIQEWNLNAVEKF